MEAGIVITLVHDISNITFHVTKALNETRFDNLTIGVLKVHMVIWLYMRLFCFAILIYNIVMYAPDFDLLKI